jgi:hypothetical protein
MLVSESRGRDTDLCAISGLPLDRRGASRPLPHHDNPVYIMLIPGDQKVGSA